MEGRGTLTYSDGGRYIGNWVNDNRQGYGVLKDKHGKVLYDGAWFNDKMEGRGTLTYSDGGRYIGDWVKDKREGFGTLMDKKGKILFTGMWKNDERDNSSKPPYVQEKRNPNVCIFGGKRYEKVNYKYWDGEYNGWMVDEKRVWYGAFTNSSTRGKYEGDWVNDKMDGYGTYTWANGETYTGDFLKDKITGRGTYTYENGQVYDGEWINGRKHGQGTQTNKDGTVLYSGLWKDNQPAY